MAAIMAAKYFWIYLGAFFAGAITLIAVTKRFAKNFADTGLLPTIWGIVTALAFGGLAFLTTLMDFDLFTVFWILATIFIGFGILHIFTFHKRFFYRVPGGGSNVILGELLFSFALIFFSIVAFLALMYFFTSYKEFPFYPMLTSMLAFFAPLSIYYTFDAAYNIPRPVFATWLYPVHDPIDLPDERPNEKLVVIAFEIAKSSSSAARTNFRAKGPETMKLGDLYYHFINDYNELHSETTIEYADQQHDGHEWWFRLKPKFFRRSRIFDPELTIRENKIRENTVIICERLLLN
jgi:hypothetical protein